MSLEEKLKKLDSEDSKKSSKEKRKFYFGCLGIILIIPLTVFIIDSVESTNLNHCNCRDAFIWTQSGYNRAGYSGKLPKRSDCAKKYANDAAKGVSQSEMNYYGADTLYQSYFNRMCNN